MRTKLLALACCVLLAGFALQSSAQKKNSEEAAIRAADAKWLKAAAARDVAIADCYTDDAVMMEPGMPAFVGKEAIREQWRREMSDSAFVLTWSVAAVEVSGQVGFTRGRYEVTYTNEKGVVVDEVGKYLTAWRKVGQEWKVAAEIYNADSSPVPHS